MVKRFNLVGKEGQVIELSSPYLNDQNELGFLYCSHFVHSKIKEIVFTGKDQYKLELRGEDRVVAIRLGNENSELIKNAIEMREFIMHHLRSFSNKMSKGIEEIRIYPNSSEKYPYYVTTKCTEEFAGYTGKYYKGLYHYVNQELKKNNQEPFESYDEMQEAFGKLDVSTLQKEEDKDYYQVSFEKFMQLFIYRLSSLAS